MYIHIMVSPILLTSEYSSYKSCFNITCTYTCSIIVTVTFGMYLSLLAGGTSTVTTEGPTLEPPECK